MLRAIEEEGIRKRSDTIDVALPGAVALYILNHKRSTLSDIEERYESRIAITGDDSLVPPNYRIGAAQDAEGSSRRRDEERSSETEGRSRRRRRSKEPVAESGIEPVEAPLEAAPRETQDEAEGGEAAPRKRRRRARRGGRRRSGAAREAGGVEASEETAVETVTAEPVPDKEDQAPDAAAAPEDAARDEAPTADAADKTEASDETEKKPKRTRRSPRRKAPAKQAAAKAKEAEPDAAQETASDPAESTGASFRAGRRRVRRGCGHGRRCGQNGRSGSGRYARSDCCRRQGRQASPPGLVAARRRLLIARGRVRSVQAVSRRPSAFHERRRSTACSRSAVAPANENRT